MFGMPVMLRVPDVVGVRLTGGLPRRRWRPISPWRSPSDCARWTRGRVRRVLRPRRIDAVGRRSRRRRQHGARVRRITGFFPIDGETLAYLRHTGRDAGSTCGWSKLMRAASGSGSIPSAEPALYRRSSRSIWRRSASASPGRGGRRTDRPACGRRCTDAAPSGPRAARRWHDGLPRRRRGDRGHHQLHQHLRSAPADRRRPACAEGARARAEAARLGEDVAAPRIADGASAICNAPGCWRIWRPWASASSATAARPASAIPVR